MQYYTFELGDDIKTFVPLPQLRLVFTKLSSPNGGVPVSRHRSRNNEMCEETMERVFADLSDLEVYIDGIPSFSKSITFLFSVNSLLTSTDINPLKCKE
jgi:hypothetical protein